MELAMDIVTIGCSVVLVVGFAGLVILGLMWGAKEIWKDNK